VETDRVIAVTDSKTGSITTHSVIGCQSAHG